MRFRKAKIAFLIIDLVLLLGSIALYFILDPLKTTREELERFYVKELKSFSIDKIISIPYKGGRGDYKMFKSTIHNEYYPILLEFGDDAPYNLFKIGTIVDKPAFSVNVMLREGDVIHHVKIRNPSDENSKDDSQFLVLLFGFLLVLFLFLPNAFFEFILNIWFNDKDWS